MVLLFQFEFMNEKLWQKGNPKVKFSNNLSPVSNWVLFSLAFSLQKRAFGNLATNFFFIINFSSYFQIKNL